MPPSLVPMEMDGFVNHCCCTIKTEAAVGMWFPTKIFFKPLHKYIFTLIMHSIIAQHITQLLHYLIYALIQAN